MKVKELIEKLQKLDPNLDVCVTCDDPDVRDENQLVRPFEIDQISVVEVELSRDANCRPQIAATAAGEGRQCALIELLADF